MRVLTIFFVIFFFFIFQCTFPQRLDIEGEVKFSFQNDLLIEKERQEKGEWVVQQGKEGRAKFNLFTVNPIGLITNIDIERLKIEPDLPQGVTVRLASGGFTIEILVTSNAVRSPLTFYEVEYELPPEYVYLRGKIQGNFTLEVSKPRLSGSVYFKHVEGRTVLTNTNGSTTAINLGFDKVTEGSINPEQYTYQLTKGLDKVPNVFFEVRNGEGELHITRDAISEDSGFYTLIATAKGENSHFGFFTTEIQIRVIDRKKLVASIDRFDINNIKIQTVTTKQVAITVIGGEGESSPTDYNWTIVKLPFKVPSQFMTISADGLLTVPANTTISANGDYEIVAKTKNTSKYQGSITNVFTLRMINLDTIIFSNKNIASLNTDLFLKNIDGSLTKDADGNNIKIGTSQKVIWRTNGVAIHTDIMPSLMVKTIGGDYKDVADLSGITFSMTPKSTDYYDGIDPNGITMDNQGTLFDQWTKKAGAITYTVTATGDEDDNNFFGSIATEITFASAYVPAIPNGITASKDNLNRFISSRVNIATGQPSQPAGGAANIKNAAIRDINPLPNDIRYVAFGGSSTKNGNSLRITGGFNVGGVSYTGFVGGGFGFYMSRNNFVSGVYKIVITNLLLPANPKAGELTQNTDGAGFQFATSGGGHNFLVNTSGVSLIRDNTAHPKADWTENNAIIPKSHREIIFIIKGIEDNDTSIDGLMFIPKVPN